MVDCHIMSSSIFLWFFFTDARVSLSGGSNEGQGTIQIYHENQWGTICDDGFDVNAAKVICKMIGHHTLLVKG